MSRVSRAEGRHSNVKTNTHTRSHTHTLVHACTQTHPPTRAATSAKEVAGVLTPPGPQAARGGVSGYSPLGTAKAGELHPRTLPHRAKPPHTHGLLHRTRTDYCIAHAASSREEELGKASGAGGARGHAGFGGVWVQQQRELFDRRDAQHSPPLRRATRTGPCTRSVRCSALHGVQRAGDSVGAPSAHPPTGIAKRGSEREQRTLEVARVPSTVSVAVLLVRVLHKRTVVHAATAHVVKQTQNTGGAG